MPIIQAISLSGKIIENAKWEIKNIQNLQQEHLIQINLLVSPEEKGLIKFLSQNNKTSLEKTERGFSVNAEFKIINIKHLLSKNDNGSTELETMVFVTPLNRTIEGLTYYLLDHEKCDPKFMKFIKDQISSSS